MKHRRHSFRDRITIEQQTVSADTYGQNTVTGYAAVAGLSELHADFLHTGGTETFRGRQIQADVIGVFELRLPRIAVSPEYRVVHLNDSNTAYEIVSARPAESTHEGGDKYMWIFVKALGS